MTPSPFDPRPRLGISAELATLLVMLGLSAASAAVWAAGTGPVLPQLPQLPGVVITGKAPVSQLAPLRLPTVVVTARRLSPRTGGSASD